MKVSVGNISLLVVLVAILIASSIGIAENNKKREMEKNNGTLAISVVGLIVALLGIGSIGFYIVSGGREAMLRAEARYN